jgi:hypothetical protein
MSSQNKPIHVEFSIKSYSLKCRKTPEVISLVQHILQKPVPLDVIIVPLSAHYQTPRIFDGPSPS